MSVTRKQTEELAQIIAKDELNRPDDDSFFQYPEAYYRALSTAHKWLRDKIAEFAPELVVTETSKTSADSGLTYELDDFHMGQLEVWAPPGPPRGTTIPPALPESPYFGFFVDGTTLRFTSQKLYSPLYIRWIPETLPAMTAEVEHTLPAFCEPCLIKRASYIMAGKSGFLGDPMKYKREADYLWSGDPEEPSDSGILGKIQKASAYEGLEASVSHEEQPWWRGLSG